VDDGAPAGTAEPTASAPTDTGRRSWPRRLPVALIAAVVGASFALDLGRSLSWESLLAHRAALQDDVGRHPVRSVLVYFVVYVAVTALSLPGAAVMTLAGGALFGRWPGTAVVSVASTAGATAAFLATRHLFRDAVRRRWGRRLGPIDRAVEADGPYYLLTVRLVPAFPFFLVNIALGLTPMRVGTFWWASQLGMLPGTFLYVNAGTELGRIAAPRDVLSPAVLGSLALLGVLPLVARTALSRWERRRPAPRRAPSDPPAD
jgi:uncharacterized membrane protein YdjX (TVP38/TMEM64 family)